MWAVRRPDGSAPGCRGRQPPGTVWGFRDELSSLQGAGIPGVGVIAPEPPELWSLPLGKPQRYPDGSRQWWEGDGPEFILSFRNKPFCRAALS